MNNSDPEAKNPPSSSSQTGAGVKPRPVISYCVTMRDRPFDDSWSVPIRSIRASPSGRRASLRSGAASKARASQPSSTGAPSKVT